MASIQRRVDPWPHWTGQGGAARNRREAPRTVAGHLAGRYIHRRPGRRHHIDLAEIADLNSNGIFDDAPGVIADLNHDGVIDARDLRVLGVASNIVTVPFHINGATA